MSQSPPPRRRVALWNAAFGYATLGSTLARNILLVPLYLTFMQLGEYGAWLATGGALVQMLVTDYGLAGVLTQRIAGLAGAGDVSRLRDVAIAGLVNAAGLALVLVVAGSLFAFALPATQGLDVAQIERVTQSFLIAVVAGGIGIVAASTTATLRGLQSSVTAGSITLVSDLASIVLTIVCLFADLGLYALALALLLRSVLCASAGLVALLLRLPRASGQSFSWDESRELWRDSARFFLTSIAMRLQSQANLVIVGVFLGPRIAATYGLTVRAHETVLLVLWQLNAAIGPVLAHLVGSGERARLDSVVRNLLPLTAAIAAVGAACTIVLNESFVSLWIGGHGYAGHGVTIAMGAALWFLALASVGYEALVARGDFAFIARVYLTSSVLHVALLLALVNTGPWAAPAALCVSSALWGGIFWWRVLAVDGAPSRLRAVLAEPLLIATIAGLCALALGQLLPRAETWAAFLGEALIAGATVSATLLILRPPLRQLLRAEMRSTLRALRAT